MIECVICGNEHKDVDESCQGASLSLSNVKDTRTNDQVAQDYLSMLRELTNKRTERKQLMLSCLDKLIDEVFSIERVNATPSMERIKQRTVELAKMIREGES